MTPSCCASWRSACSSSTPIGWLVGKRKENLDINASEIANTKEIIAMWKVTAQEMSDKVKELSDKVDVLTTEVHHLRSENADLKIKLGLDESKPNKPKRFKPDNPV